MCSDSLTLVVDGRAAAGQVTCTRAREGVPALCRKLIYPPRFARGAALPKRGGGDCAARRFTRIPVVNVVVFMAPLSGSGSGSSADDDAMDEQTLVYWLNSLPIPSALLASSIQELDDGDIIIDVVEHLFPDAEDDGPLDLERAIAALASGIGGLPQPFSDPRVAYANVLGGGHYALCWIAAVLRFAAGDGPPLGFKGSGDFKTYVDMGGQMDRVGSPRQEWGMANGSPSRRPVAPAPGDEDVADDAGEEEPGAELPLPTALPGFDEVWRKSDGQWQPAAPGAPAHRLGLDGDLAREVQQARELLQDAGLAPQPVAVGAAAVAAADDPTDEDAMRETLEQRFGAIKRRVDLSGRPARHAHSWNASTYVELDEGVAAPAPPAGKQLQLLLADAKPTPSVPPEPEEPLYTRRGNLTERGLLVGTLCDPAPGSHIRTAKQRSAAAAAAADHSKPRSPPRPASPQRRRARSQPRAKKAIASRRKQRQREHEVSEQRPFELDARGEKVLKWLATMPLDLGPLAQSLKGVTVARRMMLPRDILRKAFGAGRLLCQLVNVLEETHACTSTKSPRVNVNRALAMMRQRPSMNIQHLWATDELLDADAEVTFDLFTHIRQSYAGKGEGFGDTRRAARAASADKVRPSAAPSSDVGRSSTSSLPSDPPLDANGHAQATHGVNRHWAPLLPVERRSLELAQQHENSTTDETVVRRRLRKLGFDVPTRARLMASNAGLLKDPLRNGTLLCALVERLDPRCKLKGVTREPDSLEASVANVEIAFAELRCVLRHVFHDVFGLMLATFCHEAGFRSFVTDGLADRQAAELEEQRLVLREHGMRYR